MTGVDQAYVWLGEAEAARDHVLVSHHHQPTTIHARSYINDRYKLTVYCNRHYGELFDLQADSIEINNLWDDPTAADLKTELIYKLLLAEMAREEPLDDERAQWPNKSREMYAKSFTAGSLEIIVDPANDTYALYALQRDPQRLNNLWDDPQHRQTRDRMILALQFARMAAEPMWMPRIAGA
jgi:hypothetical protein